MQNRNGDGTTARPRFREREGRLAAITNPRPVRARSFEWLRRVRDGRGSQLVEFALSLPFLAVLLIGIADFGEAYNINHIMANAARDAAGITVSNALTDALGNCASASAPCEIQAAADAAKKYLDNNGLTAASCITPDAPSSSGALTWTYSCPNGVSLTINKGFATPGGPAGTVVPSTQVTMTYPYKFSFGYVIGLLGGTGPTGTKTLSTTVVMQNLVF